MPRERILSFSDKIQRHEESHRSVQDMVDQVEIALDLVPSRETSLVKLECVMQHLKNKYPEVQLPNNTLVENVQRETKAI